MNVCDAVMVTYSSASGKMAATYAPTEGVKAGRARVTGYNRNRAEAATEAAIAAVENYREREGHTSPEWASADNAVVGRVARNAYVVTFTGTIA